MVRCPHLRFVPLLPSGHASKSTSSPRISRNCLTLSKLRLAAVLFDCPPLVELENFICSKFRRVFPVTERGVFYWFSGMVDLSRYFRDGDAA